MKTYVFVYGTLKKGFGNHRLLQDSEFVGNARTTKEYLLCDSGFPAMLDSNEEGLCPVEGEVYIVDDATLKRLDRLEGEGHMYFRRPILVCVEDEEKTCLLEVNTYIGSSSLFSDLPLFAPQKRGELSVYVYPHR